MRKIIPALFLFALVPAAGFARPFNMDGMFMIGTDVGLGHSALGSGMAAAAARDDTIKTIDNAQIEMVLKNANELDFGPVESQLQDAFAKLWEILPEEDKTLCWAADGAKDTIKTALDNITAKITGARFLALNVDEKYKMEYFKLRVSQMKPCVANAITMAAVQAQGRAAEEILDIANNLSFDELKEKLRVIPREENKTVCFIPFGTDRNDMQSAINDLQYSIGRSSMFAATDAFNKQVKTLHDAENCGWCGEDGKICFKDKNDNIINTHDMNEADRDWFLESHSRGFIKEEDLERYAKLAGVEWDSDVLSPAPAVELSYYTGEMDSMLESHGSECVPMESYYDWDERVRENIDRDQMDAFHDYAKTIIDRFCSEERPVVAEGEGVEELDNEQNRIPASAGMTDLAAAEGEM
ncbi:MAG: hypothetical protein LBH81_01095 [Rickettsiales bacterium]|jgi:hypothetical protein|nr:hypothetical protein [Rickettsiales bacterium]